MAISQIPTPSPYPAGSTIVTSTNASWSIPAGSKHLIVTIKGGDGTNITAPYSPSGGAAGGTSSVVAGSTTFSARGGAAAVAIQFYDISAGSGPTSGEQLQVHINPAGLSTLNVTIGSGGNGHVVITHYL